jgi:PASTA domain
MDRSCCSNRRPLKSQPAVAEKESVAALLPARFSRLAIHALALVIATAGLTSAASSAQSGTPATAAQTAAAPRATLLVPDVRGQAYVFAKGILEDAGFAWRVRGGVNGFAANLVATQRPAPRTRLVDTGAPTITLQLNRNTRYAEDGVPENFSPYAGTRILRPAALKRPPAAKPKAKVRPKAAPPPARKARQKTAPTTRQKTAPKARPKTAPKARPKAAPKTARTARQKTVARARPRTSPEPAAKRPNAVAKKPAAANRPTKRRTRPKTRSARPVAFIVPGAPKEPLNEMPLPRRARALGAWLTKHPRPTDANVAHWLYQHAWIVTGAKFGWWRGAEALRILIAVDNRVIKNWGIGTRSRTTARAALAEVEAKSR